MPSLRAHLIVVSICLLLAGCDQQQPTAAPPSVTPGVKPGETPPPEPHGSPRERDAVAPATPATAPTTPGVPNHPAAPVPVDPLPTPAPTTSLVPDATAPSPSRAPVAPSPATASPGDFQITSAVYQALAAQPALSIDGTLITITTRDGNVTLQGTVADQSERDHLASLAEKVAGVRAVDNRLTVKGP